MINPATVSGMILTGGKSSRMRSDKALLSIEGSTFVGRIAGAMRMVLDVVSIVSDRSCRHEDLGYPVVHDVYEQCGPLGGIHAALKASPTPFVFLTACDTPFVTPALISRVLEEGDPFGISICSDGATVQPLIGIYPVEVLGRIESALDSGMRSVMEFLRDEQCRILEFPEWQSEMQNINTPGEYLLRGRDHPHHDT